MKNRTLGNWLKKHLESQRGRLIVLTGARQTGKTTLIRHLCPDYTYISFDDPVAKTQLQSYSAQDWIARHKAVVFDEIQKSPDTIGTVKAIYDQDPDFRIVLLGSSQILLMEQVRETLAGRASLAELMPLTLPEIMTDGWNDPVKESRLIAFLKKPQADSVLALSQEVPAISPSYSKALKQWERILEVGSMPYIWQGEELPPDDARDWLRDYVATYLQRDVRDLVALRDLEPFVRAQQAAASLTGCLLNASEIARTAGVSPATAQRFLRYLEMSYQSIMLPPWFRNKNKRLAKSPKIHIADNGVLRAILRKQDSLDGAAFESAVVSEIYRQITASRLDMPIYHLRTTDGREVDLLIESEQGYIAVEIKVTTKVTSSDTRHLTALEDILDKPIVGKFVISNDPQPRMLANDALAIPVALLLS